MSGSDGFFIAFVVVTLAIVIRERNGPKVDLTVGEVDDDVTTGSVRLLIFSRAEKRAELR